MKDRKVIDLQNEIWKTINNFSNYKISNYGRVKRKKHKNSCGYLLQEKLINGHTTHGYKYVNLTKNGETSGLRVHRLVAEAFIPNPNNLPQVNHKDENKLNNKAENLEWCNAKYNINYGNHNKKIQQAQSIKVNQYDLNGNIIKKWNSMMEVERTLKIPNSNICKCCRGLRNKAGGYIWKYEN